MKTKYIFVGTAALVAFMAAGAAELPEIPREYGVDRAAAIERARGATAARFPDADTVVVANATHVEYNSDGTGILWEEAWVKALTEKGRRSLLAFSYSVSERYGRAEIQSVDILGTNGVMRGVDFARTLKKTTDDSAEGANIYDPLDKNLSCAVPGIEIGETRRMVVCERIDRPRMRGAFDSGSQFELTSPLLRDDFTIIEPSDLPLRSIKLMKPFGKTVECAEPKRLADGRTLRHWTARDVPQAFPEPSMPSFSTQVQRLGMSTLSNWEEVSRWYWNLCAGHIAATSPAMTNHVRKTLAALGKDSSREAKVRELFRFVSQEVRYMGVTLEEESPGFAPHDVCLTFERRHGVCRDKAALLVALLRIAGIEAYPVLVMVGPKKDRDIPSAAFNHAVVCVRDGELDMLMDPTCDTTCELFPAYLMDRSYVVCTPGGETLKTSPVEEASKNSMKIDTTAILDASGNAAVIIEFDFSGYNDHIFRGWLLKAPPARRRDRFEAMLRSVTAGAELLQLKIAPEDLRDTETPLKVEVMARFPSLVLRGATRCELTIPFAGDGVSLVDMVLSSSKTALEERRFPLRLSSTAEVVERVHIATGEALGPAVFLPGKVSERVGGYSYECSYVAEGGTLTVERRRRIDALEFSPEEYVRLRATRQEIEEKSRAQPLFAKVPDSSGAEVRVVNETTDVRLESPLKYERTCVWTREVLSAQGVKSQSELKYSWNPLFEDFEFVGATVSNRNGRVLTVSGNEINVLDGGWAASAPRYPAPKRLVVNLPGVEVGSVITAKTVRRVRNSPLGFTDFVLFDSMIPVGTKSYRVGGTRMAMTERNLNGVTVQTKDWCRAVTNPVPLKAEPSQPPSSAWRDYAVFSTVKWPEFAARFDGALARARADGSARARELARELTDGIDGAEARIKAIRDHLVRKVRVVGPGLYSLPFDKAFFPPDRSLDDGYASHADWINLYRTMLEAVGFDCSFELADCDAGALPQLRERDKVVPRPDLYGELLIRASFREGGFLWFGGEKRVFHLELENEHVPVGSSTHGGETAFDLENRSFVKLEYAPGFVRRVRRYTKIALRENGAADFDVEYEQYGWDVGGLRRQYSEMLPEKRLRHYRSLVGDIAESATATSELETDVTGYPFRRSFKAYAPGYAALTADSMTVRLGGIGSPFSVGGPDRTTPILLSTQSKPLEKEVEVVFPKGYVEPELLPPSFQTGCGVECQVAHEVRDGQLIVKLRWIVGRDKDVFEPASMFPFFREWNRRITGPQALTITARKVGAK